MADDGTVAGALAGIGGRQRGTTGAVVNIAILAITHDAAVTTGIGLYGMDGHSRRNVTVGDVAVVIAHDAADVVVTGDTGVGEGEVVDFSIL